MSRKHKKNTLFNTTFEPAGSYEKTINTGSKFKFVESIYFHSLTPTERISATTTSLLYEKTYIKGRQ